MSVKTFELFFIETHEGIFEAIRSRLSELLYPDISGRILKKFPKKTILRKNQKIIITLL